MRLIVIIALLFVCIPQTNAQVVSVEGGSGTKISQGILTNAHVVGNKKRVKVCPDDYACSTGTVIKIDKGHDLALIRTTLKIKSLSLFTGNPQGKTITMEGYQYGNYTKKATEIRSSTGNYYTLFDYLDVGASGGAGTVDGKLLGLITQYITLPNGDRNTQIIKVEVIQNFLENSFVSKNLATKKE